MTSEISGQTNGYGAPHHATSDVSHTGNNATVNGSAESPSPSKDEIGWYFVEQYYTTLSKNPEKLHLFYAKRSQFVSGLEAEKAPVCVGQRAIADRIKELDIQDAKVRVTNVDSQESGRDIVAQVIGEMSNKGLPHRKFVQTFILAEQPNGYYVLNDIFRYIADEDEDQVEDQTPEEVVETVPPPTSVAPKATLAHEDSIEVLDKKLEETVAEPEVLPTVVAATQNEPEPEDTSSESAEAGAQISEDKPATPEQAAQAIETEEEQGVEEQPKDPEPTPAPSSPVKTAAVPVAAPTSESAAPAKAAPAPKTWASMLAGNKTAVAVPQIPASTTSQPKANAKPAPVPVAVPEAISAPGAATTVAGLADDSQVPSSPGGWQTAGQEHNRKQHRQQPSALGGQAETTSAYIKNVTEKVDASLLKQTLSKFGKLAYFDVSRPKNCAFVEFDTQAAFQAAVTANPHILNGVEVLVAERLPRAGDGFSRGGMRGGRRGMENRTNSQGGRGGFNRDARGNFANRGARGGAPMAQRERPGTQI